MRKKTGAFGSRRKANKEAAITTLVPFVKLAKSALDSYHAVDVYPTQCWWRNTAVHYAAEQLEVASKLAVGAMFYQAGLSEFDMVVFGDMDMNPTLPGHFHVWAEVVGHLVDISSPH
jgi:anti-sigma factor RsiW